MLYVFFFFNDTATTEIYTLPLHDALPISRAARTASGVRSRRTTSAPVFDSVYSAVLTPPMWSKRRNVTVRRLWRGTLNFASSGTKSWTAALLAPVGPDENSTSPGRPSLRTCWDRGGSAARV